MKINDDLKNAAKHLRAVLPGAYVFRQSESGRIVLYDGDNPIFSAETRSEAMALVLAFLSGARAGVMSLRAVPPPATPESLEGGQ